MYVPACVVEYMETNSDTHKWFLIACFIHSERPWLIVYGLCAFQFGYVWDKSSRLYKHGCVCVCVCGVCVCAHALVNGVQIRACFTAYLVQCVQETLCETTL